MRKSPENLCYNRGVFVHDASSEPQTQTQAGASEVTLDPRRQEQAKAYARRRRQLFFLETGLSGLFLLAWLIFGWSAELKRWLLTWTQNDWLLVLGFGAVFGLTFQLLELPLAYYSGFVLPHRYGQSTQTFRGWVKDQLLGLALSAVFGLPILSAVYWLLRVTGEWWWLLAALGYLLFAVVMGVLAPIIILPLFNKYTLLGEEHAELTRRLTALAERAGTHVAGVFRFDMSRRTKSANAALTGLGRTRRILLGDTLLEAFTTDEIETILAHELAHHVHRDIPRGLAFSSGMMLIGLYLASLVLNWGVAVFGFEGPADIAALPLLALTLGAFGLVMMPLGNAYSRWRERLADRYALEVTHKPEAFASAFARLANQNLSDADPEAWAAFLFASHPPLRERIAAARAFAAETNTSSS
ncbi:MAG: M48 family metallopeptidase [Anaerolineales bacterium]|nr:M48 family metallopeptidase [Anaerolineales bacterium]